MTKKNKIILICSAVAFLVILLLVFFLVNRKEETITYRVTFDTKGGSIVREQLVNAGEKATKPEDPTKEGYIFVDWKYNNETFDFSVSIEKNITLKAEWLEVEEETEMVTVKFATDGGSTISNQIIEKGEKAVMPEEPKKEGYIFKGWYHNDEEFNFDTPIDENIELTSKWEKEPEKETNSSSNNSNKEEKPTVKKYTITFNSNGGSAVASQTVEEGKKVTQPSSPTRNGYTFTGWTLNGSAYDFNKAVTSNMTLTATWKEVVKNNYTVTFDSNGGSAVASQTVVEGNKATQPAAPTREGYTFNGWTLNGSTYNFDNAVTGNITLVASWNQKNYTIKAIKADAYSPDAQLSVYENGTPISVKSIKYSDGTLLCNGSNTTVAALDIEGETSFIVVLSGGTEVRATLQ